VWGFHLESDLDHQALRSKAKEQQAKWCGSAADHRSHPQAAMVVQPHVVMAIMAQEARAAPNVLFLLFLLFLLCVVNSAKFKGSKIYTLVEYNIDYL
jgi:hypothetical protein